MTIRLVVGPPTGGKSTYVQRHKQPGDVVIDADALAVALGSTDSHDHPGHIKALAAHLRDVATLKATKGNHDVWIVSASPSAEKHIASDEVILCDPGKPTCLSRAANRPRWTSASIEEWYERRDPDIVQKRSTSRRW